MTPRRRKDSHHLADAREHIRVLREPLTRGTLDDTLVRDAVSHRLEVAIDAIGKISPSLLETEAPHEWPKIVGTRNILAHQYSDLDREILQNTIDNRLGDIESLIDRLLRAAANRGPYPDITSDDGGDQE